MVAYGKVYQLPEDLGNGVHNLGSDQLRIALTTLANIPVSTDMMLGDLTEITYTGITSSERNVSIASASQTTGVFKLMPNGNTVLTATAATNDFGVVVLFNDTPSSPADPLISWWSYGADISLGQVGETLTVDWDDTNGIMQLAFAA